MDEIKLKNYRCFRDEQTARLAPLTLLVGENSTGKTSFMAIIRALLDVGLRVPDFKEDPYDLGSFDEIAHHRGARGSQADTFEAGFYDWPLSENRDKRFHFEVTFGKRGTTPVPVRRGLKLGDAWIEEIVSPGRPYTLRVGTPNGAWEMEVPAESAAWFDYEEDLILPLIYYLRAPTPGDHKPEDTKFVPLSGSPSLTSEDWEQITGIPHLLFIRQRPFASAPVRSKPRRTYDPSRPTPDPEGDYVPMYLANLFFQDKARWEDMKRRLEGFGKASGLFGEISIRPLGKRESEPFQVQVRKFGGLLKGPPRNLIDVGYGVSQILPVITELLRQDAPKLFLLQQPEVHLHPRAQAALGSLFCQVAGMERQLVVETHSDYLIDRVRMDVRDGASELTPDDVSILFFERTDLDVHIHSLRIDEEGNIVGEPKSYRKFFMEETARDLGL